MNYILFVLGFVTWMSLYWLGGGTLNTDAFYLRLLQACANGLVLVVIWKLLLIMFPEEP